MADKTAPAGAVRDPAVPVGAPGAWKVAGAEPREKIRPLSATEVARAFIDRATQANEDHTSVELTRNAKGDTQVKVAVRDPDPDAAAAKAHELYVGLCAIFPMGSEPAVPS
jgi:hypothetical protein